VGNPVLFLFCFFFLFPGSLVALDNDCIATEIVEKMLMGLDEVCAGVQKAT
jgi:hypothetical protein